MSDQLTRYIDLLAEDRKTDSADLNANKRLQLVLDVIEEGDQVTLVVVTHADIGMPKKLYNRARGVPRQSLALSSLLKTSAYEIYSVTLIKSELPAGSRFFVHQDGEWIRVLNPYASNLNLPEGWSFSPHHLYLCYRAPAEIVPLVQRHRVFARTVGGKKGRLTVAGVIISTHPITEAAFVIRKFRDEGVNWQFPVQLKPAGRVWGVSARSYQTYRGEYAYKFTVEAALPWEEMRSSIYSALVETAEHKSGLYPFNKNIFAKDGVLEFKGRALFSYIDVVASNIRFELLSFPRRFAVEAAERVARQPPKVPVCLIGEYTNAARDNGLRLFEAVRKDRDVHAWYVIEEDCGMAGARVLTFGSEEHFVKSLQASAVVFSHHPNYVLPEFANKFRPVPARTMFLQHGVTALKNSMPAYHRSKRLFDAFVVCSRSEAEAIEEACGYPSQHIVVTGMPRLDRLYRLAHANKGERRDIVIFPTWRRGLDKATSEEFLASEFFRSWTGALAALRRAGAASGKRIVLISHPIIERHIQAFEAQVDLIVDAVDLQETLVGAACLVTDYSSVAFDAAYISVPILFFTFDDVDYGFAEGAFVDVDSELPGVRFRSLGDLEQDVADLDACLERSRAAATGIRHKYFRYVDDANSSRVISTVKRLIQDAEDGATVSDRRNLA